ncbi:MAG: tRNA pseudouridine(38-40) synthase TruA [Firmicutes bacterium]|nr:tRNA pseudouridine(38-40) synthase TruA [Bacillota bacterium]MBQ9016520.1 tRNA pseudouridine(38-40) synthase TruA [Bacillota bacterium]
MKNILLTIAYDGSRFHGWQRQPQDVTVQGYLEQTFSRLFDRPIELSGTSRTDAGVHALGQRASFQEDINIPEERLARVLNNALCGREEGAFALAPVRILEAKEMPEGFHARFDSRGKKYIYRISASQEPDIFRRNYVYFPLQRLAGRRPAGEAGRDLLDLQAMQQAARQLIGTQDFKSFEASGGTPRQTTVRTIFSARVLRAGDLSGDPKSAAALSGTADPAAQLGAREDEILFEVSGDGFLYNMVRILTGTLVEIGLGRRDPEDMRRIIESKDRRTAGHTAPPCGLYLAEVYYG